MLCLPFKKGSFLDIQTRFTTLAKARKKRNIQRRFPDTGITRFQIHLKKEPRHISGVLIKVKTKRWQYARMRLCWQKKTIKKNMAKLTLTHPNLSLFLL